MYGCVETMTHASAQASRARTAESRLVPPDGTSMGCPYEEGPGYGNLGDSDSCTSPERGSTSGLHLDNRGLGVSLESAPSPRDQTDTCPQSSSQLVTPAGTTTQDHCSSSESLADIDPQGQSATEVAGGIESLADLVSHFVPKASYECKSIGNLVFRTRDVVLSRVGVPSGSPVVQIVESLIWVFLARRTSPKIKVLLSDKEYSRYLNGFASMAERIQAMANDEEREQSYCKYWLDTLLCRVFKDEQRPEFNAEFHRSPLFSGILLRITDRAVARRDMSFIYSLQKGSKQMWQPLGRKKKEQALLKHSERLSSMKGDIPDDLVEEIRDNSRRILKRMARTPQTKFMPSSGACNQNKFANLGALGLAPRLLLDWKSSEAKTLGKLRYLNTKVDEWRRNTYRYFEDKVWSDTSDEAIRPELFGVKVMAIPEPGKFRIITKGDGYLYTVLQPIQGQLLSAWKKSKASTMLHSDLTARVQAIEEACAHLPMWCSVDYEAATDLLKKMASVTALGAIEDLAIPSFDLAMMSLLEGKAEYPGGKVVDTLEGQLMGHPLSFPLLCIINQAVLNCATRRWTAQGATRAERARRSTIGRLMRENVIVNGDDMLFKCEKSFYEEFKRTAADVGFKMSQGKQYLSEDCALINSQCFRRTKAGKMKRYGYLNLRLVKGNNMKNGESNATPTQIGKDLSKMVELCRWSNSVIPAAFARWDKEFFGNCYRPNWYLPVHLGGLGVNPKFAPSSWRVTKDQRLMAARFVHDPRLALFRIRGSRMADFKVSEMAGAMVKYRLVPGQKEDSDTFVDDPWMGKISYALRAAHRVPPGDIDDRVIMSKFRPEHRLKPMSFGKMFEYWTAKVEAVQTPVCPPVSIVRVCEEQRTHYHLQKLYRPTRTAMAHHLAEIRRWLRREGPYPRWACFHPDSFRRVATALEH